MNRVFKIFGGLTSSQLLFSFNLAWLTALLPVFVNLAVVQADIYYK